MKSVPGELFFNKLLSHFSAAKIIAEDLGDIDKDVINLRNKFNFPGMHVLQFENDLLDGKKYSLIQILCYLYRHT